MSLLNVIYLSVLLMTIGFGVAVFVNNVHRSANQHFLLLSLIISAWMYAVVSALTSTDAVTAAFWIRQASVAALFVPLGFNFLRLSIRHPEMSWGPVILSQGWIIIGTAAMVLVSQTSFYLEGAVMPVRTNGVHALAEPQYGPGFILYNAYFIVACGFVIYSYFRDYRGSTGVTRLEFQFILLGWIACCFIGVLFTLIIPLVTGSSQSVQFSPFCVVPLVLIIAYGIATQRIMEVGAFLRRFTAYGLMSINLILTYLAVWWVADVLVGEQEGGRLHLPHLVAALAVAFSMAPAYGLMQRFANRLFINSPALDLEHTLEEANKVLQSVTRLDALLSQFATLLGRAFGTDHVCLLLDNGEHYQQAYSLPAMPNGDAIHVQPRGPLAQVLKESPEPLVADLIARKRPTPALVAAAQTMKSQGFAVATGIRYKESLEGIIFLGPRLSGRIYGSTEQDAIKLLGHQLGAAIENAKLYTEVQDGKIYNNMLLDNLVSGVIAANSDGEITVFNREAQRITGLDPESSVGRRIDILPRSLKQAILSTLKNQQSMRDQEYSLTSDNARFTIRASTTPVRGYQGDFLGALVVFNDTTRLKALEEQIRRHDRLASIGTLSAGMAHEIKNPLVSIKTFTELLPERYEDAEFRERFSTLVGAEVNRIDRIVNQLLRFARPAKANLTPNALHKIIETSLTLIDQQLFNKNIRLQRNFHAPNDMIEGDADLLQQVFINFFLNAIDAMEKEGSLTVGTREVLTGENEINGEWEDVSLKHSIHVTIEDTGVGIKEKDLPHVFDPFFTTKDSGTGLGLAVAHGILEEHQAVTQVHSRPGEGTVFHIVFPLKCEKVPA